MEEASEFNNYHYNKKLKDRTRYLRKNGTKAEACIWKYVLKNKIMGYQFTRQRPVLNYIADFMCKELLLIIEVDGNSHLTDEVQRKDIRKQKDLEEAGFYVLRIEDGGVLKNLSWVQAVISQTIERLANQLESPPPAPSRGRMEQTGTAGSHVFKGAC